MKDFIIRNKKWMGLVGLLISALIMFVLDPVGFWKLAEQARVTISEEAKQALITVNGEEELVDVPTVETVESGQVDECPENTDCGRGMYAPVDTPAAFKDATNGQCIDIDGAFGSQCFDLMSAFWSNYAGRPASTCGTGAAKGTIGDGCWQKNAGSEFTMIWDKTKLQAGDWVIFSNGQWGHDGMALGGYNGGYIALYGTNQGGSACPGGGSSANVINKSLGDFVGAFRPNSYIIPEPVPEPEPEPPVEPETYTVKKGDTLGQIIRHMGWYERNDGLFGDDGYAQKVADFNDIGNRGLIFPGQIIQKAE